MLKKIFFIIVKQKNVKIIIRRIIAKERQSIIFSELSEIRHGMTLINIEVDDRRCKFEINSTVE